MKFIINSLLVTFLFQIALAQEATNVKYNPVTVYYESGELFSEGQTIDEKKHGEWVDYYKNGQVSKKYAYDNGKLLFPYLKYDESGNLIGEGIIENEKNIHIGYYENAQVKFRRQQKDGFYERFSEDGLLEVEANYEGFSLHGTWKSFYQNGNVKWQVNYFEGYRNGEYKQYYEDGQLKLEGVMIENQKKGEEKRYTPKGVLEWKGYYNEDQLDRSWIKYDADGKKQEKIKFKDGEAMDLKFEGIVIPTEVPDGVIERVPVFPGCEYLLGNKAQKKCMSKEIAMFINRKFDIEKATDLGLTGRHRIVVIFYINEEGLPVRIQARGSHPEMEDEAIRVIEELPRMEPGTQYGNPVEIPYSMPIVFQIVD